MNRLLLLCLLLAGCSPPPEAELLAREADCKGKGGVPQQMAHLYEPEVSVMVSCSFYRTGHHAKHVRDWRVGDTPPVLEPRKKK